MEVAAVELPELWNRDAVDVGMEPHERRRGWAGTLVLLASLVVLPSCTRIEAVLDEVRPVPATPHEAYLVSLADAGLDGTALATRWEQAAAAALRSPVRLAPPFEEVAFYPAEEPTAAGYLIRIDRGQNIHVSYAADPPGSGRVFIDIYRVDSTGPPTHVAHAEDDATGLEFEPSDEGDFLVRVQPELLRDVRVRLRIVKAAVLAFPVMDHDAGDIQSFFGAEREGGRREHHGVDIFAPRGTPVLAAADGTVSRVGDQRLGGRVVWLRDERRGTSQYYAHLDRQLVERGQRVRAGDTLGLVGNTGNARTTPPHLHFGIYVRRRGPIDPFDYLDMPSQNPPRLRADSASLGEWLRTRTDMRITLTSPEGGDKAEDVGAFTVVRVLGAAGRDLRVRLPDGRSALIRGGLESLETPIDEAYVAAGEPILSAPDPAAARSGVASEGAPIPVVGRFSDYFLVRPEDGRRAWVQIPR
jgi:murein DD-endopeptidase MepM/ murein hydrolase activator NlpD